MVIPFEELGGWWLSLRSPRLHNSGASLRSASGHPKNPSKGIYPSGLDPMTSED
jgi:hypothetical protein